MFFRWCYASASIVLLCVTSGCGPRSAALPPAHEGASGASGHSRESYSLVRSVFGAARRRRLQLRDLDNYIHPSVQGEDRKIARRLLGFMPPDQRGDFVYTSNSGHTFSNNPEILKYVTIQRGTNQNVVQAPRERAAVAVFRNAKRAEHLGW